MNRNLPLLARYAEGLFWMARYLERVENMARLIDVTQSFESPGREAESWFALVRINADMAAGCLDMIRSQIETLGVDMSGTPPMMYPEAI